MVCCYIALGSNIGRCGAALASAVKALKQLPSTKLVNTSFMYRSEAQLVQNQPDFLNAVVHLDTQLEPPQLLQHCQRIEVEGRRAKSQNRQRFGPREIDLDIVLYANETVRSPDLSIPHPRMHQRDFVLRPLVDLGAGQRHHQELNRSFADLLAEAELSSKPLRQVLAFQNPDSEWTFDRTRLMGIINTTPDSFSDGGVYQRVEDAIDHAKRLWEEGADILDVGGQSTRPHAELVSVEDEEDRVVPVIRGIRQAIPEALISVDTFYANVAEKAVAAGANMVNDVSGGQYDERMLSAVAELGVPYVFMHIRGSPATMNSKAVYTNVVEEVQEELLRRYSACIGAGILRWNLVADPGIGFAKNTDANLALLRRLPNVEGVPTLVGLSRKRFLGEFCGGREARQRDWATAAACVAAVQAGADILRVHSVKGISDAVAVADAIYKSPSTR